ncbi:hypothetical protein QL285_051145 [Trifolium repens]|nr:hypothetical protein QL285_051145 [Trifolium repens]
MNPKNFKLTLSAQCIINGLPKHAYEDEIRILTVEEGPSRGNQYYKSSTFLALSFITKRGISLYDSYPFAGDLPTWRYREDDRDFDRNAGIYRPFKVPIDVSYYEN